MLIAFEGINGSGKTTISREIFEWMVEEGYPVMLTKEPRGYFKECTHIHNIPEISKAFLYFAGRAYHVKNIIIPAIERGKIVLCDRFRDSTDAYQIGLNHLNSDLMKMANEYACYGYKPNMTIYLKISDDTSMKRSGSTDLIQTNTVNQTYERLASENNYTVINAELPIEAVVTQVKDAITKKLTDWQRQCAKNAGVSV